LNSTTLEFIFEIQLQYPGQDPQTVFRDKVKLDRNVVNLNTLLPATLLGLQTTYTALFGGVPFRYTNTIAALDTEVTASFALGYRVDFARNGSLQKTENSRPARPTRGLP
jgi:hypothetical protein